jgi:hypothetical protein
LSVAAAILPGFHRDSGFLVAIEPQDSHCPQKFWNFRIIVTSRQKTVSSPNLKMEKRQAISIADGIF